MERVKLCTLSTLIILLQSPSTLQVTVSSNMPRVEVPENADAVLSCVFRTERDNNPRIEWKKKDKDVSFVYFDGKFRGDFHGRAEIEGATVTLKKVTQKDTGEYRCEISAPLDTVTLGETNVTLKVLVPPHTPSCEIPSSALTGSVVELRCNDKQSVPPASYRWYKDNALLTLSHKTNVTYSLNTITGTLRFDTVSRADTGQYHCEAFNGLGSKSCVGKHMQIDDVNIPAIIAAAVAVIILISVCFLGVCYAHRHGYFSKGHRGRSFWIPQCHGTAHISSQNLHRADDINSSNYNTPLHDDFKHTQSFML
ncbi:junctional adhesion molecule 2A isoform X1 [Megalops cyprinoides]|uniref:junctional adhesion molecule 2A isoform X1 n=1 Tax=Megalops cyprinoides TaxID=118141 RepID=UPI001864E35B|nr:junctional adhesion molecule 2A isoform X1 [Megalops cyprinoides]